MSPTPAQQRSLVRAKPALAALLAVVLGGPAVAAPAVVTSEPVGAPPVTLFVQSLPELGVTSVHVEGNQLAAVVAAGGATMEVTVSFEQVVGLTIPNLGLSARAVTPAELAGRLPGGTALALPLLFDITPPAAGGLAFQGLATVDIHTHDLQFAAPLRLFAAHGGGSFADITESHGTGSYRARGSTGGFSEFIIVTDTRALGAVIDGKLAALQSTLTANAGQIGGSVLAQLQSILDAAELAWQLGNPALASQQLSLFATTVQAASGLAIPNVWRSSGDLVNAAGDLRAATTTLRFSLNLAS